MSDNRSDFIGEITPCNVNIKGIGGSNQIIECITMFWVIEDDKGKPQDDYS